MQIAAGFNLAALPTISVSGGPLVQLATSLSLAMGTFKLDDLPMLEFQMEQAATSFTRNVWPRLGWLTTLKIQPLINFALIAQLVLDLTALGIDPFTMSELPAMATPSSSSLSLGLTPPQIQMARLVASLPNLLQLSAALNLPPLGESGGMAALQSRLSALATLSPPCLSIPMSMLTKLALVLQSLATIETAFEDAFSPATLGRIKVMLSLWASFRLPFPALPALALMAKLDTLPSMEDINLGQSVAGSEWIAARGSRYATI